LILVREAKLMRILCVGDAMIPGAQFAEACAGFGGSDKFVQATDWETSWDRLQNRRLDIEKRGPDAEPVLPEILEAEKSTEVLLVLFAPVSASAMDALPCLRLIGAARAGLENVDVEAATSRGIAVLHLMGRNAHAVSDFVVGMMLSEARNIARAHASIKAGAWRKEFPNSGSIPELVRKTVGIIGFGYIGRLAAKKMSGFETRLLVYDPFVPDDVVRSHGATPASKDELLRQADFVTIHARLTESNKGFIGRQELDLMKPTSILINTARAGLIDEDALFDALSQRRIAGAALDVFWTEPLPEGSRWLGLDNVTLTTHIAGTTSDALRNSPYLLVNDMNKLLLGHCPEFIVNPEVLEAPKMKDWLSSIR
jgi:D-3-phosphoglycerate dehydrogenase / 2-oxoglutarate reductase